MTEAISACIAINQVTCCTRHELSWDNKPCQSCSWQCRAIGLAQSALCWKAFARRKWLASLSEHAASKQRTQYGALMSNGRRKRDSQMSHRPCLSCFHTCRCSFGQPVSPCTNTAVLGRHYMVRTPHTSSCRPGIKLCRGNVHRLGEPKLTLNPLLAGRSESDLPPDPQAAPTLDQLQNTTAKKQQSKPGGTGNFEPRTCLTLRGTLQKMLCRLKPVAPVSSPITCNSAINSSASFQVHGNASQSLRPCIDTAIALAKLLKAVCLAISAKIPKGGRAGRAAQAARCYKLEIMKKPRRRVCACSWRFYGEAARTLGHKKTIVSSVNSCYFAAILSQFILIIFKFTYQCRLSGF